MRLIIRGRIPSLKNSKIMVCRGSRPVLLPSKSYQAWHEDASYQLMAQRPTKGIKKCEIEMTFYFPDNRKADLTNKAESVMDLLADCGIITDDAWQVVCKLTLVSGGVDKNPRVEICLTSFSS